MTETDLAGLAWVRLTFVDVFGQSNSLQLPASRYAEAVATGELFDGSALQGRARSLESDMRLAPDPKTLYRVGDVGRVACTVLTPDGDPWPGDPRTALAGMLGGESPISDLASVWTSAAELELYLLDDNGPVDRAGYFDDREGLGITVVRQAAQLLLSAGIEVLSCHHEAGPGQYEIDLAPLGPLALADALVLAKATVREVAAEAGLLATFMARPLDGEAGSGLHLNQTVPGLIAGDGHLSEEGRSLAVQVDPSLPVQRLLMRAGACALDDGRTQIDIDDIWLALTRDPTAIPLASLLGVDEVAVREAIERLEVSLEPPEAAAGG